MEKHYKAIKCRNPQCPVTLLAREIKPGEIDIPRADQMHKGICKRCGTINEFAERDLHTEIVESDALADKIPLE
jgi:hypothetical protein